MPAMALGGGSLIEDGGGEGGGSSRSRKHGMKESMRTAAPLPPRPDASMGHAAGRAFTLAKATGTAAPLPPPPDASVGYAAGRASTLAKGAGEDTGANNRGADLAESKDGVGGTGRAMGEGVGGTGRAMGEGVGSDVEGRHRITIHLNGAGGRRARMGSLFEGFRFVLLGFGTNPKLQNKIIEMGGTILNPSQYENSTHLCLMEGKNCTNAKLVSGVAGKTVVTQEWINKCCAENAIFEPESEAQGAMVVSTGKKPRPLPRLIGAAVKRCLNFDEDVDEDKIRQYLHHLFFCEHDLTENVMSLADYNRKMKGKAAIKIQCPGSEHNTVFCTTTIMEVKNLVKDVYLLLKKLNEAGLSLRGNFSAKNFVLVDGLSRKKAMFGQLEKGSLKRTNPDAKKSDMKSFKVMVRTEVFSGTLQPHDMTTWISLVGCPDLQELIPCHLFLMEDEDACNRFLGLCDTFKDEIEKYRYTHKKDVFDRIVKNLQEYDNWQRFFSDTKANAYLKQTFERSKLPNSQITYANDVSGLLRLLRNYRHHASREQHRLFLLIVGHHFPNLVYAFQVEMYKEGYRAYGNVSVFGQLHW